MIRSTAAVLIVASVSPSTRAGPPLYTVTDLGALSDNDHHPGGYSEGWAINNRGQVAGVSFAADNWERAFLWTPDSPNGTSGTMADLGITPSGRFSIAIAINDVGEVAGWADTWCVPPEGDPGYVTFVAHWRNGGLELRPAPAGYDCFGGVGNGMNDAGDIVGSNYLYSAHIYHPDNTLTPVCDLACAVNAFDINNLGQVVGSTALPGNAYVWQGGTMTALEPLGASIAYAINDRAQIVGNISDVAAIWLDGQEGYYIRPPESGWGSSAYALNEHLEVVGIGGAFEGIGFFYWADGVTTPLQSRVPDGSPWMLTSVHGINNAGQIVATGFNDDRRTHALLLTPCPADFNHDGRANIFDFLSYQTAFGDDDPAADLAPPFGILNIFDFLAFQTLFSEGC